MMRAERDRLSRAIEILGTEPKRRGRPAGAHAVLQKVPTVHEIPNNAPIRRFSAATRRKMAASQKRRWAARKAKKAA
jgi:hypothetical protein